MKIAVFGNPALAIDSLPLQILPALQAHFPQHEFVHLDPNEEWDVAERVHIIDTVVGLETPRIFTSLDAFMAAPRMTCHDFDAYANLMLLMKLGKVRQITIYGLPPHLGSDDAVSALTALLPSGQ